MTLSTAPRRLHVVIAFTLVYILWGSTYLAIRLSVDHLTPLIMGGLRFTVAGLLMLGLRALGGHRIAVPRRDLIRLAIITASGWQMLFAGLICTVLALVFGDLHRATWAASSLWAVLYLIFAGSLIGFTAYVWLLKNVPIAKVATYAYVNPIIALLLGCLFHGEKMDRYMLAGSIVVIFSVILVTGAKVHHRAADEDALDLEPVEPTGD
jgi:drug/metabolite transporter (DMT)-like permease